MYATKKPLNSKDITAAEIKELCTLFNDDLDLIYTDAPGGKRRRVSSLTLPDYYDLVRLIKYRRDPDNPPVEVIARPYYLFKYAHLGLDCKKKAILIGSFCNYHNIDYRFIGSSNRPDKSIHHIYPEVFISGKWQTADATYAKYRLFEIKTDITKKEVL